MYRGKSSRTTTAGAGNPGSSQYLAIATGLNCTSLAEGTQPTARSAEAQAGNPRPDQTHHPRTICALPAASTRSTCDTRSWHPPFRSEWVGGYSAGTRAAAGIGGDRSIWCPTWPITWQRAYATARQWWLEADGRVDWAALPEETVFDGEQLGRWMKAQRAGWAGLEPDQQDLLTAIGIEADEELVAAEAKPEVSRVDRFARGLAALARLVEREGHVRVPRPHKEPLEVAVAGPGGQESTEVVHVGLGAWLNNQKARRAKLTAGQLAQLVEHGVEWA
ncbi:helicase associated domain-containing protein [Kitasatospora sp. KL5]|uniref:helicase associated domain-containing protein n=1 Tax=Kitasatospora sp. KL5 TaxID=3425125 RepID=UPI003D6F3B0E